MDSAKPRQTRGHGATQQLPNRSAREKEHREGGVDCIDRRGRITERLPGYGETTLKPANSRMAFYLLENFKERALRKAGRGGNTIQLVGH